MFRVADGSSVRNFCQIVRVETGYVIVVRAGKRLLRLNDFEIIHDSGSKAILSLGKSLLGQVNGTACNFHLVGGGRKIKQRSANLIIYASAKIVQLRSLLAERGLGL